MQIRNFGYIQDPADRVASFKRSSAIITINPFETALLVAWCPPVSNQGSEASCTGQVAKNLCDITLRRKGIRQSTSALFPYANGRMLEWGKDAVEIDMGAYYHRTMESLVAFGNVPYVDYGTFFDQDARRASADPMGNAVGSWKLATETPDSLLYEEAYARRVKIADWVRVYEWGEAKIAEMERLVSAGYGVGFGGPVSKAYTSYAGGDDVFDPGAGEIAGMHAQTIVGYERPNRVALLMNSWGEGFGGNKSPYGVRAPRGYCWVPYSYLLRDDVTDFSAITDCSV